MKFTKDVLYPGTYTVSDGKGGRKKVHFSRQKVQQLGQRMQDMLGAGLSIPLAAEHQDRAKPLTEEERKADWVKKLTLGYAEQAQLAPEGFLTSVVEVPIDEEARRMPAVRFVSPEIQEDFVDGSGRLWPGPSITHLAATPRPVQIKQKPFQPVQLSSVIRLSLSDYEGDMAEEKPEGEGGKGEGEGAGEGASKGFDLEALRKVLEEDGYAVPDHITDPTQFLEHLHTAAMSKAAMVAAALGEDEEEEDEPEEPPAEEPKPAPEPASGPIMMSHGGRQYLMTPVGRPRPRGKRSKGKNKPGGNPPVRLSQPDPRAARLEANLLAKERSGLKGRITALFHTGRITKPIHDRLQQAAGTVRLSLDDSGSLSSNSLVAQVEAYEQLPAQSAWPTTGALPPSLQPAEPPAGAWGGASTPAQTQERVNAFFEMVPGGGQ